MHILITGGAGFIGSHLCDRLVERGASVWCIDNLRLGRERNIAHLMAHPNFRFARLDMLDEEHLKALFAQARFDAVYHLAANSDIGAGIADPELDLKLNFLTTTTLLRVMKAHDVSRLFFASTSAIFGESGGALGEDHGPLKPISFYGASKLAAEAYISVYAHTLGYRAVMLRFPNVIGERATHGAIYDFLRKLKADPKRLEVLGDGNQTKPYLYVGDLIDAIFVAMDKADEPMSVYHAAGIGETSVREIAEIVVRKAGGPATRIVYTGSDRGWPGDVPRFRYDISKLQSLGWTPRQHSTEAVAYAVDRILANGF